MTRTVTLSVREVLNHSFKLEVPDSVDATDPNAVYTWASEEGHLDYSDGDLEETSYAVE